MMTSHKQSLPSSTSILSVLSIVFYCAGFLRVELERNEQKTRLNALGKIEETKLSDVPNSLYLLTLMSAIFARPLWSMGRKKCQVTVASGSWGRQVINFANTNNRGRFCLFLSKRNDDFLIVNSHSKFTVRFSTRFTTFLLAVRTSTVASTGSLSFLSLRWKAQFIFCRLEYLNQLDRDFLHWQKLFLISNNTRRIKFKVPLFDRFWFHRLRFERNLFYAYRHWIVQEIWFPCSICSLISF